MPHLAAEDYLADIYRLETAGLNATTGAVAERRSVTPASTTAMFKRLARDGLVAYHEYEGVVLTEEGQRQALAVLRRHRLVERFLTDVLRIPWDRVDHLADEMEHALPDEVVDALEELLRNPFTCPHGYPIPDRDGRISDRPDLRRLCDLPAGAGGTVAQVDERVPGLLAHLESVGIVPGAALKVVRTNEIDQTVALEVVGAREPERVVGARIAQAVRLDVTAGRDAEPDARGGTGP